MRILSILIFLCILISLTGCSSMRGNVVPQTGPSMEEVYDGMGINKPETTTSTAVNLPQQVADDQENQKEADLTEIRQSTNTVNKSTGRKTGSAVEATTFRKLPNPELTMYVYPHLAGAAEIPIPGYTTVFNAYSRDHYALPQETTRD